MKTNPRTFQIQRLRRIAMAVSLGLLFSIESWHAQAQCPVIELTTGLAGPLGITLSKKDNLLVSESGPNTINSGRISIVNLAGTRRILLDGLPSGINDVDSPSGPAGVFLRGRTLYVVVGSGDSVLAGPTPGTGKANPNPSSPLFSSILAIHFSASVETNTPGFTLALADQQKLASGKPVTLSNAAGETITIEMIVNFPDYTPEPRPSFAENVRNSNPFALVAVGDQLYVTDGGQNLVWRVDLSARRFSVLTTFPSIPNPQFNPTPPPPSFGGPTVEAVPTGIVYSNGKLLVTLFRGFPFPTGTSVVEQIDPVTGTHAPFISGLTAAIGVLPIRADADSEESASKYLVLQHASGPFLSPPGLLLRFNTATGPSSAVANCLTDPSSMILNERTGTLYVAEVSGRIVAIPVASEAFEAFNFNLNRALAPSVLNASTRGQVGLSDNVMIAGFILGAGGGGGNIPVVVRAIGPSLSSKGVSTVLQDPTLELHDASGNVIASNDNWKSTQQTEIQATGLAPTNDLESAILSTLPPGAYSAIIRGKNNGTGIGLIEVYNLTN